MKWLGCVLAILLAFSSNAYIDKSKIGWDQHIGTTLPLDLQFKNTRGQPVRLGDLFGDRPVALAFVYLSCPELCPEVLTGIQQSFDKAALKAGQDYEFIAVSIDPRDSAANAAARVNHVPLSNAAHIHVLTTSNDNAALLARAVGFRYVYDERHQQFAHPAGFIVTTPDGKISRYFFGVRYDASELRSAVEAAHDGAVSNIVRQFLLVCFHFDPTQGPYSTTIMVALRALSLAMFGSIAVWIAVHMRRKPV